MSCRRVARITWLLAIPVLLASGCSRNKLDLPVVQNLRPVVKLTFAPASTSVPSYYSCEFYWTGADADGFVHHYLYCVDPPTPVGADTPWVATTDNRAIFSFRSDDPNPPGSLTQPQSYHVFVIKAVDNLGAESAPVVDAFSSFTLAPTATILQPPATSNALLWPTLPPEATFVFTGNDPDGRTTTRPVMFKYKLFSDQNSEFDFHTILLEPDALRRHYAPAFATWDSVTGDTCKAVVRSMVPGSEYVFAVVAIDEAGAYSPVFTLGTNLFRFGCSYAGTAGPRITIWSEYFYYRYLTASYNTDPTTAIAIEVPSGRVIGFNWSGAPLPGAEIRSYRWAIDIASLDDETPRSDEATDYRHWSTPSSRTTSCLVGPFPGADVGSLEEHIFYLESEDTNLLKSLAMVRFRVTRPSFLKPLLFVDDTRFWPDQVPRLDPDTLLVPGGLWPSAAELDTFLFARGGVRWRYYVPSTQKTPPGIFAGYTFDTLSTRRFGMTGTIPLWLLGTYRHVVWMTDPATAYNDAVTSPKSPMPMLRKMCSGAANALGAYNGMGGDLWLMGGGIAFNSMKSYNSLLNDHPNQPVYAYETGELVPGRLMYDLARWQTEISIKQPTGASINGGLVAAWPGAPDYSKLPRTLGARTDPTPPMRNPRQFAVSSYTGEVLTRPLHVVESDGESSVSVLDTLYFATGGDAYSSPPLMSLYHGSESATVIFSGFPLWYVSRAQAITIGDFVLQDIWKLPRNPVPR